MNVSCANLDKKTSNLCDYYQKKQHFSVFIVLRLSLADHPRRHMMTNDNFSPIEQLLSAFFRIFAVKLLDVANLLDKTQDRQSFLPFIKPR